MKAKTIGKYEVQAVIGEGSFGKVYLGVCGNERMALKCISKKSRTLQEVKNIKSQANLLTAIKHENIIMLKQCLEIDNDLVFVMEYAGNDLAELLKKMGKLPEDRIRFYAKQILDAMLYLHQNRILHRDLKPQNILLQKDVIKICDFGFAKQMSASTNFLKSIKGTPLYIAPEILLSRPYTHKVDVWSFGIILYELATGCTPFYASTLQKLQPKILHEPVKFPSSMNYCLRQLIDGMLQKSEMKRFNWQQVKNHKFFSESSPVSIPPMIIEQKEKLPEKVEIKWDAQEQCCYIMKMQAELQQGKLQAKNLRLNQQFCLRITQFLGQACIQRQKISADVLLKAIRLLTKLAKIKIQEDSEKDLIKNKNITTAIISLGLEETNEDFLKAELQLIAFLLKQNFDKIKIDTDHEPDIISLVTKILSKKQSSPSAVIALKLLGILTSQAMMTLTQSQEYFERVAEEKLLTLVAESYFYMAETNVVLQCIAKFIHPKAEKIESLSHKTRLTFTQLKEQVANVFLKQGYIREQPLLSRNWKSSSELQVYCQVLLDCLQVSGGMRNQFLKYEYWYQLLSNSKTRVYFYAYHYLLSKDKGKATLSNQIIAADKIPDDAQHELVKIILLSIAAKRLKNHPNLNNSKIQRIKLLIDKLQSQRANSSLETKQKRCLQLKGSLSDNCSFYDDIVVETIIEVLSDAKCYDTKCQDILAKLKPFINQLLLLPLSQQSLIELLDIIKANDIQLNEPQAKKCCEYLTYGIRKEKFDDYLAVNPKKCGRLLTHLLNLQFPRLIENKDLSNFAEIVEKHQFLRLLFSQQISGQELVFIGLRTANKILPMFKRFDISSVIVLRQIKKYYYSDRQDLNTEIISLCSNMARNSPELAREVLNSGVVALCSVAFKEGSESLKEIALHLIGNLAKHNEEPSEVFQSFGIVADIAKCIATHKNNPKILKNTIYAIGNISYYSSRFAADINPMIRYLREGLKIEDERLLSNTLSTISNLLRHGDQHLQVLIDTGILGRVIELYAVVSSAPQVNLFNNLLKKAAGFSQFLENFQKKKLREILQSHINKGLVRKENQNARRLLTVFS